MKISRIVLLIIFTLINTNVLAGVNTVQGTVHTLRDNSDELWGEDSDFLLLNGVTSSGSCPKNSGLVIIRIPKIEKRAFSMALAAQMAGKAVMASIDDNYKDSTGKCILRWLNIVN